MLVGGGVSDTCGRDNVLVGGIVYFVASWSNILCTCGEIIASSPRARVHCARIALWRPPRARVHSARIDTPIIGSRPRARARCARVCVHLMRLRI